VKRITRVLGDVRVQALTVRDVRLLLADTALLAEWTRWGMLRAAARTRSRALLRLLPSASVGGPFRARLTVDGVNRSG
jgi:hypothetical protein